MSKKESSLGRALVDLMKGAFFGDRRSSRTGRRKLKREFPDATGEELEKAKAETPPKGVRWAAVARAATPDEGRKQCGQCKRAFKEGMLKECPGCGVTLHAACYDDAAGGYRTPGCRACRGRTGSR